MATWKEPKNDYKKEDQVVPEIFNTLAENERYLQEKKITTEQVQDAEIKSTQSASRESLGDKETVKGFFGKIRKWLADLKALAFKGTVGTADIDNYAVTSAKIASSAVTSAKIGSSAVTTAKISAKAVTDEKINSVSASKVTGLHKVATSGSYNDLTDKPSVGGFSVTKYRYDFGTYPLVTGVYMCFVRYKNNGSIVSIANCGLLTISPWHENPSYSGISAVYDGGNEVKIQVSCTMNAYTMDFGLLVSPDQDGKYAPTGDGYLDGAIDIVLYKIDGLEPVPDYDDSSLIETVKPEHRITYTAVGENVGVAVNPSNKNIPMNYVIVQNAPTKAKLGQTCSFSAWLNFMASMGDYEIYQVTYMSNGVEVTCQLSDGKYQFSMPNHDCEVTIKLRFNEYGW